MAKKVCAPRLADGTPRVSIGHCLPPDIKAWVQRIARSENQSVSWVLEQVIIDYFDMILPRYKNRNGKK